MTQLKEFEGVEEKIRKWAGNNAKLEVKYSEFTRDLFISVSNEKFFCLVNLAKPEEPYGLGVRERNDEVQLIKKLFENSKKVVQNGK